MTNENCYAKMEGRTWTVLMVQYGGRGGAERTVKDSENEKNILHLKSNKIKEIHLYVRSTTKKNPGRFNLVVIA